MKQTLTKLNNLSLRELHDLYWLKMYPRGLSLQMSGGKIVGLNMDTFIANMDKILTNGQ